MNVTEDERAALDQLVSRGCITAYKVLQDGVTLEFLDGSVVYFGATCDMMGNSSMYIWEE